MDLTGTKGVALQILLQEPGLAGLAQTRRLTEAGQALGIDTIWGYPADGLVCDAQETLRNCLIYDFFVS